MSLVTFLTPGTHLPDWKLLLNTPPLVPSSLRTSKTFVVKLYQFEDNTSEYRESTGENVEVGHSGSWSPEGYLLLDPSRYPTLPVSVNSHEAKGMEKLVFEWLSEEGGPLLLSTGKLYCWEQNSARGRRHKGSDTPHTLHHPVICLWGPSLQTTQNCFPLGVPSTSLAWSTGSLPAFLGGREGGWMENGRERREKEWTRGGKGADSSQAKASGRKLYILKHTVLIFLSPERCKFWNFPSWKLKGRFRNL